MRGRELRELVEKEATGQATERERALLRDPARRQRWKETLAARIDELDAEFARRSAEALRFKKACLAQGLAGKRRWLDYRDDHNLWRAESSALKTALQARLKEARGLCSTGGALPSGIDELLSEVESYLASLEAERGSAERERLLAAVRFRVGAGHGPVHGSDSEWETAASGEDG